MKRICAIILAAVLSLGSLVSLPFAVSADSEEDFLYEIVGGEATVTGYAGKGGSYGGVQIPSTLGSATVTAIGDGAFASVDSIYSLTLPDSIKTIGDGAFRECAFLKTVNIPTSTVSIGDEAFLGCTRLMGLRIPASVTHIGNDAFLYCGELESITVAEGNTAYRSEGNCLIETATNTLLKGCFASVIPEGITTIARGAFSQCVQLESIAIPDSVTVIEEEAFYATGLKGISIPKNVKKIGRFAFGSQLESITVDKDNTVYYAKGNCLIETATGTLLRGCINSVIPEGVKIIGDRSFENIYKLSGIFIPEGVTEIGAYAFASCYHLSNVILPESLTKIGNGAFSGIPNFLKSIYIPASVTEMGAYVFDGSEGLDDIYCGAEAQPEGWAEVWTDDHCNAEIHWGAERPFPSCGDLSGDGKINATDYLMLKRFCLGTFTLTDEQRAVADVNWDGKINAVDYLLVKRHVLGTFKIG